MGNALDSLRPFLLRIIRVQIAQGNLQCHRVRPYRLDQPFRHCLRHLRQDVLDQFQGVLLAQNVQRQLLSHGTGHRFNAGRHQQLCFLRKRLPDGGQNLPFPHIVHHHQQPSMPAQHALHYLRREDGPLNHFLHFSQCPCLDARQLNLKPFLFIAISQRGQTAQWRPHAFRRGHVRPQRQPEDAARIGCFIGALLGVQGGQGAFAHAGHAADGVSPPPSGDGHVLGAFLQPPV